MNEEDYESLHSWVETLWGSTNGDLVLIIAITVKIAGDFEYGSEPFYFSDFIDCLYLNMSGIHQSNLRNRDWFCPFYKVIDEDELMTTEHNALFMSQIQVSDIVTSIETLIWRMIMPITAMVTTKMMTKKMMTNVDKLFKVGHAWKPSWTLLFHR